MLYAIHESLLPVFSGVRGLMVKRQTHQSITVEGTDKASMPPCLFCLLLKGCNGKNVCVISFLLSVVTYAC